MTAHHKIPDTKFAPFLRAASRQVRIIESRHQKILTGQSPEAIHDFRIATRRLQAILECLLLKDGAVAGKIDHALRRARRAFSSVRNYDVLMAMASARLQGNAGPQAGPVSDSERSAWREFSKYLKQQRARSYKKAVRKIHQLDIENLCSQLKRELQSGRDERLHLDPEFPSRIAAAVRDAWGLVQKAGQKALVSHAVKATHAFRIAAKNLRYRLEAMQESRLLNVSESLHELKRLQQSLGSWHDREVLQEALQAMLVNTNLLRGSWSKTRHVVALAISLDAEKAILAEDCYKVSAKVLATIEKLDPGSRDQ